MIKKNNIKEQISEAEKFFDRYPNCIKDFLYKPKRKKRFVDVDDLIKNIDELNKFDILGIAEKELGPSPQKKV